MDYYTKKYNQIHEILSTIKENIQNNVLSFDMYESYLLNIFEKEKDILNLIFDHDFWKKSLQYMPLTNNTIIFDENKNLANEIYRLKKIIISSRFYDIYVQNKDRLERFIKNKDTSLAFVYHGDPLINNLWKIIKSLKDKTTPLSLNNEIIKEYENIPTQYLSMILNQQNLDKFNSPKEQLKIRMQIINKNYLGLRCKNIETGFAAVKEYWRSADNIYSVATNKKSLFYVIVRAFINIQDGRKYENTISSKINLNTQYSDTEGQEEDNDNEIFFVKTSQEKSPLILRSDFTDINKKQSSPQIKNKIQERVALNALDNNAFVIDQLNYQKFESPKFANIDNKKPPFSKLCPVCEKIDCELWRLAQEKGMTENMFREQERKKNQKTKNPNNEKQKKNNNGLISSFR